MYSRNKRFPLHFAGTMILSLAVIFSAFFRALPVYAESAADAQTGETTTGDDLYRYAITIEFGPMTFYYDYGSWNTDEMRYVSDAASTHPSADTVEGYPGWYGFDGTANKISIKYTNENPDDKQMQLRQSVPVSIDYRSLTAAEGTVVDGVNMALYGDIGLKTEVSRTFRVPHTPLDTEEKTSLYVSLGGVPTVDGKRFSSGTFMPIGMLTIRIGFDD